MSLTKVLFALALTSSVSQAFARPHHSDARTYTRPSNVSYSLTYTSGHPYYYGGYYYARPWWHDSYYNDNYYDNGYESTSVGVRCTPQTIAKNSLGVEAVLNGLASNEFSDNAMFKQKVLDLNKMPGAQRVEEGFRIVGIQNPKDGKEIMTVIYAREPSPAVVARVSENLKVSSEDAKFLIEKVTQVLKSR